MSKGGGVWRGMQGEVGVSRSKLLYAEGIYNKVLLYSKENYSQRPVINHGGKEYFFKRMYIYVYV